MSTFTSRNNSDENCFVIGFAKWKIHSIAGIVAAAGLVSGCTQTGQHSKISANLTNKGTSKSYAYTPKDKECLERAMFFESNRSSQDGLVAVGTVVMNRLDSGKWGDSICGVVGQKGQFAPGVLSRPMKSVALPDVQAAADAVLRGERNTKVKNAMYFHTAGLRFPYKNMHYTVVAGGNAFYEKRDRYNTVDIASKDASAAIANAYIASLRMGGRPTIATAPTMVASNVPGVRTTAVAAAPATTSTATAGRVTANQQPILMAQADITPVIANPAKVAVPMDPPPQAMDYRTSEPTVRVAQPAAAPATDPSLLAYEAPNAKKVDAIGQMLLAQDRPTFN
ncbi:Cell wall hydrolase CwlJ, involved in spore germination [Phyllobacterium sp. CL33Tsu]|nr:Cell wall hydrolase CwlJ, involved in spore germination [Phyllobacterium sp. CL33Tsu]